MSNRRKKGKKKVNLKDLKTYFLACEFKPDGPNSLWSATFDGFAYDVKPAFIYGSLGVIGYEPEAYSIIDISENSPPLIGYLCTITEPTTNLLLDKVKGYYGPGAFNLHSKKLVHAYTDLETVTYAWAYVLSDLVLDSFEQIEQVELGIWDDDEKQIKLLEKIDEGL